MGKLFVNRFKTTLSAAITSTSATTISLTSTTGLSSLSSGQYYRITVDDGTNIEIMDITNISGVTVVRAREGTTGHTFSSGTLVEIRDTAGCFHGDIANFSDSSSFIIPNSASLSLANTGEIGLDTTVTDYTDGLMEYFSGSTPYGLVAIPLSGLASPTDTYVVTYNGSSKQFELAAGGGGGGGGGITALTGDVAASGSGSVSATFQKSCTYGDLLYGNAPNTWVTLAFGSTRQVLFCSGITGRPAWGFVDLTASVSGTLPTANAGTGLPGTGLLTTPAASSSTALSLGTAFHNVLGYNAVLTVYIEVDAATTADILLGVGSTSTPTQQTIVSALTCAATIIVPVTINLPSGYYALLSTSGTITCSISGQLAMPV